MGKITRTAGDANANDIIEFEVQRAALSDHDNQAGIDEDLQADGGLDDIDIVQSSPSESD